LASALALLQAAKKPLLVFGKGAAYARAEGKEGEEEGGRKGRKEVLLSIPPLWLQLLPLSGGKTLLVVGKGAAYARAEGKEGGRAGGRKQARIYLT